MRKSIIKQHAAGFFCFFLLLALFLFSHKSTAQTETDWQQIEQQNGVTISYQAVDCQGQRFLALQLDNSNETVVSLRFNILIAGADDVALPFAFDKNIILEGGQKAQGNCADPHPELFLPLYGPFMDFSKVTLELQVIQ